MLGLGFGAAQAATSTAMFQAAMPNQYAAVSAIWNVAYDLGLGLGPVAFGLVATYTGYPAGFAGCAALLLLTLILYRRPTAGPTSTSRGRCPPASSSSDDDTAAVVAATGPV